MWLCKSKPPRRVSRPTGTSLSREIEPHIARCDLIGGYSMFNLHRASVCLLLAMPLILASGDMTISAESLQREESASSTATYQKGIESIVHPRYLRPYQNSTNPRVSDVGDALRLCLENCDQVYWLCVARAQMGSDQYQQGRKCLADKG